MNRIAIVVAVGSLLVGPVVSAQTVPPSGLSPSATTPKAGVRDGDFYETRPGGSMAAPKNALQDIDNQRAPLDSSSAPGGSFESTGRSNLTGSFEGTENQDVQAAVLDGTSGA
jgi:hypothetical protein